MKKILILGANSFLGYHLKASLADSFDVVGTYLSTKPSEKGFERCNLLSKADLYSLGKFDSVVQYSSVVAGAKKVEKNLEMVRNAIEYCNHNDSKFVFISSSQVNFEYDSDYKRSKVESEKLVQEMSCQYNMIRPAAPYGALPSYRFSRKQPFHVLAEVIRKLPVVPIIGDGKYIRQPVHVDNLNQLIRGILESELNGNIFELGGPDRFTFDQIVDLIAKQKERKIIKFHLPVWLFELGASATGFLDRDLIRPVTANEHVDNQTWNNIFDIQLTPFEEGVKCL